jgi:hypothetical protein
MSSLWREKKRISGGLAALQTSRMDDAPYGELPNVGYFSPYGRKITYIKKKSTMLPQATIAFAYAYNCLLCAAAPSCYNVEDSLHLTCQAASVLE